MKGVLKLKLKSKLRLKFNLRFKLRLKLKVRTEKLTGSHGETEKHPRLTFLSEMFTPFGLFFGEIGHFVMTTTQSSVVRNKNKSNNGHK